MAHEGATVDPSHSGRDHVTLDMLREECDMGKVVPTSPSLVNRDSGVRQIDLCHEWNS